MQRTLQKEAAFHGGKSAGGDFVPVLSVQKGDDVEAVVNQTCATCRFWGVIKSENDIWPELVGRNCQAISADSSLNSLAWILSDSAEPHLVTQADFGCSMWEELELPD